MWPLVILILVLAYRKHLPRLLGRVRSISFAGFSLDLGTIREFTPRWIGPDIQVDLRGRALSTEVNDSTAMGFLEQLKDSSPVEYAVIDFGDGKEWLSSRLYIMAILLQRIRSIKTFVFVENSDPVRRRFIGTADLDQIRRAFARGFIWIEQAYWKATGTLQLAPVPAADGGLLIPLSPEYPDPAINILREFLNEIQKQRPDPISKFWDTTEWESIKSEDNIETYEHAKWLDATSLEDVLGNNLSTSYIELSDFRARSNADQVKAIVSQSGRYVPLVREDRRFDRLIDRHQIIERVASQVVEAAET